MSIYSRNADPILNLVAITPRTFFWLRFFLFNFPSFWKTFAMKTELVVYFSSVTKQMNIYSRKADPILNLPTNTPRTFFWLRFFLFNFPSLWNTFAMKTELVVYFPSVTKQLMKETNTSINFSIWMLPIMTSLQMKHVPEYKCTIDILLGEIFLHAMLYLVNNWIFCRSYNIPIF